MVSRDFTFYKLITLIQLYVFISIETSFQCGIGQFG